MTIFTKAKIINLLNDKIVSGEIKKSKRTGHTIKFNELSQQSLLTLLKKKIPKPEVQNISDFYKIEIKRLNESR